MPLPFLLVDFLLTKKFQLEVNFKKSVSKKSAASTSAVQCIIKIAQLYFIPLSDFYAESLNQIVCNTGACQ